MDGSRVRAVDTATGDVTTLAVTGHTPVDLGSCASGGGRHVWVVDSGDAYDPDGLPIDQAKLLRLDMRSLVAEVVLPLTDGDVHILCVDNDGNAICRCGVSRNCPQLRRVQPDGTITLLAGADQPGYRDGPGEQAQFRNDSYAAAAGDGSIVVADHHNRRLRLVSPDGTVSTLAGSGEEGVEDGPPAQAKFKSLRRVSVSPQGDVLVLDYERVAAGRYTPMWRFLLRTVPARLQPPSHLAPAPAPPPTPPHPGVALITSLLQSGLLADLTIRVVAVGESRRLRPHTGRQTAAAGSAGAASGGGGGSGEASLSRGGPSSSAAAVEAEEEVVDIPCHRAIMATASPYFLALCDGSLARQQRAEVPPAAAAGSTAGRKRKAAGGASSSGGAGTSAAAAVTAALPVPTVVTVDDASADAVRGVLRHVYTGDLGGVTAATAQDVLHLAQLWGLDGLLEACQARVVKQLLGPNNAAQWLVVAAGLGYGTIRAAALRAMVQHFEAVRADEGQLALLQGDPRLLVEVTAAACAAARQ